MVIYWILIYHFQHLPPEEKGKTKKQEIIGLYTLQMWVLPLLPATA